MKKYTTPEVELLAFAAMDLIMASDENETPKDYVNEDLTIAGIETI